MYASFEAQQNVLYPLPLGMMPPLPRGRVFRARSMGGFGGISICELRNAVDENAGGEGRGDSRSHGFVARREHRFETWHLLSLAEHHSLSAGSVRVLSGVLSPLIYSPEGAAPPAQHALRSLYKASLLQCGFAKQLRHTKHSR